MASFPEEEDEFLSEEVLGRGWAPLERRHLKAFRIHALIGLVAGRQRMFFFFFFVSVHLIRGMHSLEPGGRRSDEVLTPLSAAILCRLLALSLALAERQVSVLSSTLLPLANAWKGASAYH